VDRPPGNDPLKSGIASRFIDASGFLTGWTAAYQRQDIVGNCRMAYCGGLLKALPSHQGTNEGRNLTWHGAECLNCGHEVWAPDGRTLARSSRHGEMPAGYWKNRNDVLKRLNSLNKEAA